MHRSRNVSLSAVLVLKPKPLAGALAAALLACSSAYAASFGHSRLVSAPGQAFHVNVPVTQLSADDLRSLSAAPAPAAAWREAGLTPPVDLATLQVHLADGYGPGSKLIQLRSSQAFNKPVADILLDVRTATGQQRYQVSLLTHAGLNTVAPMATDSRPTGSQPASQAAPAQTIRVKRGDVMFAIARRHAVPGVSIYQMMIALQRANPQAFIHDNVNLVKAGASLTMPSHEALTAISKQEAYRIFQQQAQAYAQYRQRAAAHTSEVVQGSGAAGVVSEASSAPAPSTQQARDQLRLSGGQASSAGTAADDAVATSKGIEDSQERVSQLEDNVKTLNKALQSQGLAASTLVIDGAKGLSDSIAQAGDMADSSADAAAGGASQGASDDAAQGQGSGNASSGAAQTASAGQSGASSGNAAGGVNAQGNTSAATAGSSTSAGNATTGTGSNAATGLATGNGASGATAANGSTPGDSSGGNEGGTQADASTNAAGDANTAATGSNGGQHNAVSDGGASQTAESISTKAEQSVSWFQEHMLGVITGLLAFIVLVIAWLLRRANVGRDTGREGNTGPITEAMVQEKLDQINLDFEQDTTSRSRPGSK